MEQKIRDEEGWEKGVGAEQRENHGEAGRRRRQPGHGVKKPDSLVQVRKQVITPRTSVYVPRYNTYLRIPNTHTCTHYTIHSHQHTHEYIYTTMLFTTHIEDTHTSTHTSPPHYPSTTPPHKYNSHNSSCQIHRSHWRPRNIGSLLCCDTCLLAGTLVKPWEKPASVYPCLKKEEFSVFTVWYLGDSRRSVDKPGMALWSPALPCGRTGQRLHLAVCSDLLNDLTQGGPKDWPPMTTTQMPVHLMEYSRVKINHALQYPWIFIT